MTPQERNNRLNDIFFHGQRCALYDQEHKEYSKLGLGITIYFYGGGSKKGQGKVLEIFKLYKEKYGEYLVGLFGSAQSGRFVKFTEKQFLSTVEKLDSYAKKDKRLSLFLGTDRWGDYADDYVCETLTTSPTGESEYNQLSYLHLVFPLDWLKSAEKQQEFEDWVVYLCSTFDVFHGYAGLECVLPYDSQEWEPHEYQVATHYYNVMPNSTAYSGYREYADAIKSIAWYTLLGKSMFKRIDAEAWQRLVSQYSEIAITERENGVRIVKIDDLPDMGNAAEPLLLSYQALNEVLTSIRKVAPNRLHHLHDVPHFNAVQTYHWAHRWDNPNMQDGVLNQEKKEVKTYPILVEGGENVRVPYSGIWQPYNHDGETVHLEKGSLFPDVPKPEMLLAETLWRLISRDDGGELSVSPAF
ncbi:type VI immunity family protein [Neisseria zoodegmatis]|uniref:Protein of uncharacterized function (DUF3396) n=1 Tax=Neisseria zoodegmatis TaxID=326523 RepID=A0AB38DR37_9NEIS|nr:type VI immunity family protein [Neisseria zoodegmatis]OSI11625.1 hypothetical protein BWD10_01275 [Neisseria zoodegmatis]SNU79818.1 Protein of uncharacterised function (DUF3396) [Neisseria zoodegmatis]